MGIFSRLFGALSKRGPEDEVDYLAELDDDGEFEEDEYYDELYHYSRWSKPEEDDEWYEDIYEDEDEED